MPGNPRSISLKRWLPRMSSRTMSGVHRSARISDALATGRSCLYFCMAHPGTAEIARASPNIEPDQSDRCTSCGLLMRVRSRHRHLMEVTMIRASGRLAAVLVVGLGVAAAFDRDIRLGPGSTRRPGAPDSSRAEDAETSSERRAIADWSLIAQNAIVAVGKKFPGEAAVHMGIVHATIYDAVVAIEGGYRPYAITPAVPPNTSVEAAVAAAAHRVLAGRFPDQQGGLDDLYIAYLNGIPDGEAKTNGILVGEEVGVGMLLLRANDGLDSIVPYVQRPPGPGVYEPTAPATPLGTRMPHVLPLALDSASQFRPHGPPALRSGEYARDFNEVKHLGRLDSSVRSAEQTAVARFWTDHDIPQWNRNLLRLADARGLSVDRDGADVGHGSRGRRRRHDWLL